MLSEISTTLNKENWLISSDLITCLAPCNRDARAVPGGVICIDGLASEGVLVVWSRR